MKFNYSILTIALFAANHVIANDIQELNTSEATAKKDNAAIEVSSDTIENRQVNDIKGALNQLAGVTVSNSVRYSQKTYLRGVEEHSANITIDGVRQDGELFHHAGNQTIDTSILKAVTVKLGATSVLSGYGANTGAISYQTKDPKDLLQEDEKFGAKIGVSADDATEFRQLSVNAYGQISDQLSLLGVFTTNDTGDIEIPDADPIVNKHSELESGLFKAVYDIDAYQSLTLNLQSIEDGGNRALSGEKPGRSIIEQEEAYNGYERETYSVVYTNHSNNPLIDLYINAYFNEKSMNRDAYTGDNWIRDAQGNWFVDGTAFTPERDYRYETKGLDIRNSSMIGTVLWTYGIESFKSEQSIDAYGLYKATSEDGTVTTSDLSVNNGPTARLLGAYAQAEIILGNITLIPGVRFDDYQLGGAYDLSFSKASPKFVASWQASEDLNISGGYGKIFKGPGLPETLVLNNNIQQADDVEAETGDHIELNINYDLSTLLGIEQAAFYSNVYQFSIDDSYHPTKNTNLARNRTNLDNMGVEAGASFTYQSLSGFINYSFNDAEHDYVEYKSDDLYSGTHEVNIGLTYQMNTEVVFGWNLTLVDDAELDSNFIDRSGTLVSEEVNKAGYGVSNIWAVYEPQQISGLMVNIAIDNLFDKAYQNHKSFGLYWGNADYNDNEVGRNVKASISYQF